jgi:plasmid stabilization system protein ParE
VRLALNPEAEEDILAAFRWYSSKRASLGRAFVEHVDAAFERILEAPRSFAVAYRDLRRFVLPRFPYVIYFRERHEIVVVVAVLHGRRDPRTLRTRPR